MSPESVADYWHEAERLAAVGRLGLARRYCGQPNRLDAELDNLLVSHGWLAGQDEEEAARLRIEYLEVLAPYLQQRGLAAELERWCASAIEACAILRRNPGWVLLLRAMAQRALGRWPEAISSLQETIEASRAADPRTHGRAVLALGQLQFNQGDYREALSTLAEAETLLLAHADYEGVAAARSEVAAFHLNRRELDKALALYLDVDELERKSGAAEASDQTLLMLGVVHRKLGNYLQAAEYLRQLLQRGEAQDKPAATATSAHHLAWVRLRQGDTEGSRRLCGRALEIYQAIGDLRGAADAWDQLGCIALADRDREAALYHLEQSLLVRQQIGNWHGAASSLEHLAVASLRLGRPIPAARYLIRSLALYRRLGMLSRQRSAAILREIIGRDGRG